MAKKKSNKYVAKKQKASILANIEHGLPTKGDVKNSLLETGKELLICVVGGGLVGAAIGKPSLLVGLGITGAGHYMDNRMATMFGIGVMAANGFQKSGVSGLDGMDFQSIKGRMDAYKEGLIDRIYIAGMLKKKDKGTDGFGDLQYFNSGGDVSGMYDNELSALDMIDRQLEESGMAHLQMSGMGVGDLGEMSGLGEMGELADIGDFNL